MTRMIPIKEAINIFEKHKVEKIKNDNPLLYRTEWEMSGFSTINYISQKITGIIFENRYLDDNINVAAKSLLKLVSKKYHRPDRKPSIGEGLQLYGKAHTEITETAYGNSEIEFEKIYLHYYADTESEIELDLETGKTIVKNKVQYDDWVDKQEPCAIFENYDYDSFYNSSINYTVMGSRKENKIRYTDISVKLDELMELIDRELKIMPVEHNLILDDMIAKYGDTITKLWKQERELRNEIHILKAKQDEALMLFKEDSVHPEVVCDQILEIQRERAELELFNRWQRESKSYEKDLDAFFTEDIKLQKEYNNEIDVFLCKFNSSKFIDNLIKDLRASLPEREDEDN